MLLGVPAGNFWNPFRGLMGLGGLKVWQPPRSAQPCAMEWEGGDEELI